MNPTEKSKTQIADLRRDYRAKELNLEDLNADPVQQFSSWFDDAMTADLLEPNAMTLSTATKKGRVYARTVLLKAFDPRGFVFFTNYESRKAVHIAENPQVNLLFTWLPLERQIAITGNAEKVSPAESLAYFTSRPWGSRIGAWVSDQSKIISSRKILEDKFEEICQKFKNKEVPLPQFWGGFRIVPDSLEFWQGGQNRLHDRFLYTLNKDQKWTIARLSP